jgi:protein-S-isoprenylcysteine O-methyltransferase Ste14
MYRHRGIITAFFGLLLLLLPPASFEVAGVLFFLAAFFLRIWARMHIGKHSRASEIACPEMVVTGPYKYVKHPLYISNFMAGAAFALFHAGFSFATLGFCAIYGIFLAILAINENKFLENAVAQVKSHTISFTQSIWSDIPTWLCQAVMLAFIFLRK